MDEVPSYDRLSDRIEEFMCRLKCDVPTDKEIVISKEEFYEKLSNGTCLFEGYTFKHFAIENIECETLTFIDCKFYDMKLMHNQMNQFECKNCRFVKVEICGRSEATNIILDRAELTLMI